MLFRDSDLVHSLVRWHTACNNSDGANNKLSETLSDGGTSVAAGRLSLPDLHREQAAADAGRADYEDQNNVLASTADSEGKPQNRLCRTQWEGRDYC